MVRNDVMNSVATPEAEDKGANVKVFFVPCREIVDNTGKENGINIVMPERTYHLIAESAEDAR